MTKDRRKAQTKVNIFMIGMKAEIDTPTSYDEMLKMMNNPSAEVSFDSIAEEENVARARVCFKRDQIVSWQIAEIHEPTIQIARELPLPVK